MAKDQDVVTGPPTPATPLSHYRVLGGLLKGRRRLPKVEKAAIEYARTVIAQLIVDEDEAEDG